MSSNPLVEFDLQTEDVLGLLLDTSDEEQENDRWRRGLNSPSRQAVYFSEREEEGNVGLTITEEDRSGYSELPISSQPDQETVQFDAIGGSSEETEGPSRGGDPDAIRELIRGPSGDLREERCSNARFIASALGLGGPVGLPVIFRDILPSPKELFQKLFEYSDFEKVVLRLHRNCNLVNNSRSLLFALFLSEGNNWLEHFLFCGIYVFERNVNIRRGGKDYCSLFTMSRLIFEVYVDLMTIMKITLSAKWEFNYLLYKYAFAIDYVYKGLCRLPFNVFDRTKTLKVPILSNSRYEPWVIEAISNIKETELLSRDTISIINRDKSSRWIPRFFRRRINFVQGARYRLVRLRLSAVMERTYRTNISRTSIRTFATTMGLVNYGTVEAGFSISTIA